MGSLRNTKQKQLILDLLSSVNRPVSINDIYKYCLTSVPTIAKSTIYRNIESLLSQGLIDKFYLSDNELYYQMRPNQTEHKHYLICDDCRKMFDLPVCPIHDLENSLNQMGFAMTDHYVQINGICKECQKKKGMHNKNKP